MRLIIVAVVTILLGFTFIGPFITATTFRGNYMSYTKDFESLEKVNSTNTEGTSRMNIESISMLNNSEFVDDSKHSHIFHIHSRKNPLKTFFKRMQQNIKEKFKKEMLEKRIVLPPLFVVDMIQPVVTYKKEEETNAGNGSLPGGSLSPKLSYIRLMRVLIEHICGLSGLTASEPTKEDAASSKEPPKLTNNTL